MIDPLSLTEHVKKMVVKVDDVEKRAYFRFRGGRWYGGIATADCIGCNLRCVFCWSWYFRDNAKKGRFYSPVQVYHKLVNIVKRRNYSQVRISGGEPTISRKHLLEVIDLFDRDGILFILETNGILIGYDKSYAKELSRFDNLHVRVSMQLKALENLLDEGVSVHPSIMLSFSDERGVRNIIERLRDIDEGLIKEIEEEYVFLYPHVARRLREAGIWPKRAYYPDRIPRELI